MNLYEMVNCFTYLVLQNLIKPYLDNVENMVSA